MDYEVDGVTPEGGPKQISREIMRKKAVTTDNEIRRMP